MKRCLITRWLGMLVALSALAGATHTAADHLDDCGQAYNPELSIFACTSLIESGSLDGFNLAAATYNRGVAYSDRGDHDRAIADFDAAIEIVPDFVEAYINRGIVYGLFLGDFDRAIADFDKVIEIEPDYAEAYNNRGLAYRGKDNYDRAIANFDMAIEIKPDFAEAYYNRGLVYLDLDDCDRAVDNFEKAIGIEPDFTSAHRGIADCTYAIAGIDKASDVRRDFSWTYGSRAFAHGDKG